MCWNQKYASYPGIRPNLLVKATLQAKKLLKFWKWKRFLEAGARHPEEQFSIYEGDHKPLTGTADKVKMI